jgi:hypothetical protein
MGTKPHGGRNTLMARLMMVPESLLAFVDKVK